MSGELIAIGYALSVLANAFVIGFLVRDDGGFPFFLIPILAGPLTIVLGIPFIAWRLGVKFAQRGY